MALYGALVCTVCHSVRAHTCIESLPSAVWTKRMKNLYAGQSLFELMSRWVECAGRQIGIHTADQAHRSRKANCAEYGSGGPGDRDSAFFE